MSLDNTDWIKDSLNLNRHIDDGNDINFVNYQNRDAFQFDVNKLRRAEFSNGVSPDAWNLQYCYAGSLYIPSNYADVSIGGALLMQWHSQLGDDYCVAPFALKIEGNRIIAKVDPTIGEPHTEIWQSDIVYDAWTDYEFLIDWGKNRSEGNIQIIVNGSKVADYTGINAGDTQPYWKYGCYRTQTQNAAFPRLTIYWSNAIRRVI